MAGEGSLGQELLPAAPGKEAGSGGRRWGAVPGIPDVPSSASRLSGASSRLRPVGRTGGKEISEQGCLVQPPGERTVGWPHFPEPFPVGETTFPALLRQSRPGWSWWIGARWIGAQRWGAAPSGEGADGDPQGWRGRPRLAQRHRDAQDLRRQQRREEDTACIGAPPGPPRPSGAPTASSSPQLHPLPRASGASHAQIQPREAAPVGWFAFLA